jgi:4-carboxymuconolactone decarboxylase
MAHIGIVEQVDGKAVEWIEKVSDAQYGAPLRAHQAFLMRRWRRLVK